MIKISRSNRRKGVLCLQLARERARQPRGGSNGHAFKRIGLSVWNSETIELHGQSISNQRLLERLEAQNAQLRGSAVDLLLQIQALRDRLARPQSEPPLVRRPFGLSHAAMAGCSSMA